MIIAFFWALAGLVFGSFLNVCITRLPKGESVVSPRSHCRECGQPVSAWANIPLLSWIWLGGRCRACKARIPVRYPLVEFTTSLLFLAAWLNYGLTPRTVAASLLCFLLFGLAVMDAETMLLPDRFTLPGIVLGICMRAWLDPPPAEAGSSLPVWLPAGKEFLAQSLRAAIDAAIAAACLLLVAGLYWLVRRRSGMGMGDVKLLAMLGAWLGLPLTGLAFFLAVVFGAAYGVWLILFRTTGKRRERKGRLAIAFGVFLSVAGIYSLFLGGGTLRWYMQFLR